MGKNSVRGEGTRDRVPHARDLGWDDSLYGEGGDDHAARGRRGRTGRQARTAEQHGSPQAEGSGAFGDGRAPGRRHSSPHRHGKRGKRRVLRWVASVLSLLILGTAGAGYLYYEHLNSKLKKDELNLGGKMRDHQANAAGQVPLNILLIGSDARDSKKNQELGGARKTFGGTPLADVQMLVHVSADRSNISVISMPRDTLVKIPECTDSKGKTFAATGLRPTNESLGRGGPGCTVATWYNLTGITIDHFMMIDFAGVVSMADAIGGVPVCVRQNVNSRNRQGQGSGLKMEEGTHPVKGEQALQWLRTRYGFEDGTDLARTHAQHMYMNSMVRELRKNTKLTDPAKLRNLAEAAIDALTVDKGIGSVKELYDLGEELKSVPTDRITMTTMPNFYTQRQGFSGKVEPKPVDAEQLFRMVREDIPLDGKAPKKKPAAPAVSKDPAAAPGETAVMVQNGTGGDGRIAEKGRATAVAGILSGKGFTRAQADATTNPQESTVIRFSNAELEGDAQAVAKSLGIPLTSVKKSTDVTGIALIVGADWRQGDTYPKTAAKDDNKTPTSARPLNGGNDKECMAIQPGFTW
ncbi:LCP family protein [Streptomyces sp. CA-135486]|uniref:LCP family protein n=1 Tax=Streptomyces sp. CA-135486 TaxID=3240049 RepID=UPI003D8D4296